MAHDDRTSGTDYAESVREVLAHAARSEASAAQRTKPPSTALTRGPALVALALTFAGVIVYNIRSFSPDAEPLPPEAAEMSASITVMIATQAVEAYREEHGRLPASLEALGFPPDGLEYRVDGDSYEITARQGETSVQFSPEAEPLGVLEEMGFTVPAQGPPAETRR